MQVLLRCEPTQLVTVDWAKRETVRAKFRVMVRTLLRRYKYTPDKQEEVTETLLKHATRVEHHA
ncbi:type I restriction enzyme endonuclease domain-containing protein [Bradyrhizobium sp. S3.9.2]|uniref:type I restriction enzyme endonuclease domain-containing protein n=1 Tax=Bradyrhizobium sp. S3.9.2 TaxID=3156432 RepID=UPI003392EBC0